MGKSKKKRKQQELSVITHQENIIEQAKNIHDSLGRRYSALLRRSSQKLQHQLGPQKKRRFCKRCGTVFIPDKNCTVVKDSQFSVVHCLVCGFVRRTRLETLKKQSPTKPATK
ncbi:putative ribonuclease P protein subunit RPR2 [Blattamonas nauphoetae]|uniref:Ribonuclease P protein subunit RPR2 n=1 Tax=Blattamonas nauphoetae TaxID=2049346 RepID=A0ABQ9X3L9_9EUKA|nr:putative ribonuclease P protein subunit RPR2 [Blattamonas nauphoetae]